MDAPQRWSRVRTARTWVSVSVSGWTNLPPPLHVSDETGGFVIWWLIGLSGVAILILREAGLELPRRLAVGRVPDRWVHVGACELAPGRCSRSRRGVVSSDKLKPHHRAECDQQPAAEQARGQATLPHQSEDAADSGPDHAGRDRGGREGA